MFKQSEQMNRKSVKNLFSQRRFYTLYGQKFSNLRPLFFITFHKDSENLNFLDIGLWEVGEKIPLNGVRNTDTKNV